MIAILAQAQTEHLSFMGIPLNGTIDQFQAKLQSKGCRQDVQASKTGCRIFNGSFEGEDSRLLIYYNEKSKIVYRAKAIIKRNTQEEIKQLLVKFKDMLQSKYDTKEEGDSFEGNPAYRLYIYRSNKSSFKGEIDLYYYKEIFFTYYLLSIDYIDSANKIAK